MQIIFFTFYAQILVILTRYLCNLLFIKYLYFFCFYVVNLGYKDKSYQTEWIVRQIRDIYKLTKNIAVILKNDQVVGEVTNKLNDSSLTDFTQAQACLNGEMLGEANYIRVL